MASRALMTRFMRTCSIWSGISLDVAGAGIGRGHQPDIFADQPPQHAFGVADQIVQRKHAGMLHLLAAESQQLLGERGGAFAGLANLDDVLAQRIGGGNFAFQHAAVAQNHGEQIVEVVRDAAGQAAHCFHLLRLPKLLLQPLALGDVGEHAETRRRIGRRRPGAGWPKCWSKPPTRPCSEGASHTIL